MKYRRLTLRRMPTQTRKLARLINELDSVTTRLVNHLPEIQRLELDSKALWQLNKQKKLIESLDNHNLDQTPF